MGVIATAGSGILGAVCDVASGKWKLNFVSDRPLTIDLNSQVQLRDVPDLLRKAALWWLGEISALVPGFSGSVLPRAPELACLRVVADGWHIARSGQSVATLVIDPGQDDKGVVDQILHAAPDFSLSQLLILLPQEQVLRRRIELPIMPERQVLSAVELQVDRLTPFKAENVRLAIKVVARDAVEGKLTADCAITPRAGVDALEQRLSNLGFKAARVDFADDDGEPSGFDLRVHEVEVDGARSFLPKVGLAVAVIGCWYFSGMMWDISRQQELDAWQTRIDALKPAATTSMLLRKRLEGLTEPFEIARKYRPTALLAPIQELTTVIPDTARLTAFKYEGDSIDIAGIAADASSLISTLEKSPLFKDAKFRSPVMRRPEANKDIFEISLRLEGPKP